MSSLKKGGHGTVGNRLQYIERSIPRTFSKVYVPYQQHARKHEYRRLTCSSPPRKQSRRKCTVGSLHCRRCCSRAPRNLLRSRSGVEFTLGAERYRGRGITFLQAHSTTNCERVLATRGCDRMGRFPRGKLACFGSETLPLDALA